MAHSHQWSHCINGSTFQKPTCLGHGQDAAELSMGQEPQPSAVQPVTVSIPNFKSRQKRRTYPTASNKAVSQTSEPHQALARHQTGAQVQKVRRGGPFVLLRWDPELQKPMCWDDLARSCHLTAVTSIAPGVLCGSKIGATRLFGTSQFA